MYSVCYTFMYNIIDNIRVVHNCLVEVEISGNVKY